MGARAHLGGRGRMPSRHPPLNAALYEHLVSEKIIQVAYTLGVNGKNYITYHGQNVF